MKRNIESFDSFVCAAFDDDVDPGNLPDGTVPLLQELYGVYVKNDNGRSNPLSFSCVYTTESGYHFLQ